ncbi:YcnI family copper-binding membrane protein [Lentzea sp. CA-135723]|uniref:YcnI family copper-binding membrane protein n=1 Tax=Lentzea sp. CA-135723 TaxID=3239950 RepID=UPI003D91944C
MSHRKFGVLAKGALIAFTATLLTTGTAAAHLEPVPGQAVKGKSATITFKVPNERPDAGTVSVRLDLPAENPVRTVRPRTTPGWTVNAVKEKLDKSVTISGVEVTEAFRNITWTAAAGTRIGPNEFAEFAVTLGPMPDNADKLVINAVQTYDSGEIVNWNQPPPAEGQGEPEHPAPVLKLVTADATTESDEHAAPAAKPAEQPDSTATWLGGAALAVSALALGIAIGTALRSRRSRPAGAA